LEKNEDGKIISFDYELKIDAEKIFEIHFGYTQFKN
jgi:hypothetical protein